MSDMPWFKFFPSDWLGGTRGLTSSETGIYITLIALMYERDGGVEINHARLSRLCGASNSAFKSAITTLLNEGKVRIEDDKYVNDRALEELSYRRKKEAVASRAAKSRWGKNDNEINADDAADGLQTESVRNAISEARSQKLEKEIDTSVSSKKITRGSRIPDDWEPDVSFALGEGLTDHDVKVEADKFRDYWIGKAGKDGVKANWNATWRNWIRNSGAKRNVEKTKSVEDDWRLSPEWAGVDI